MIDLRDIEYIGAIANAGSIKKAARAVGLSQPALTKRLQNLEKDLNLKLFNRLARGVKLTQAGSLFLAEGKKLTTHGQDFRDMMVNHQEGRNTSLTFGIKPGLKGAFCRASLLEFIKEYPETNIQMTIDSTQMLAEHVNNGRIDFAFGTMGYAGDWGPEAQMPSDLSFAPMFNIPFVIFTRKNHPMLKQLNDKYALFDYPLICPTPRIHIFEKIQAAYKARGSTITKPHILVNDYGLIYDLVAETDMWSATYETNASELMKTGRFEIFGNSDFLPPMKVGIIKRKTWEISPAAQNLISIVTRRTAKWNIDAAQSRNNGGLTLPA